VPPPPWHYSGDVLTAEYRTDPANVAALLPDGVDLAPEDPGEDVVLRAAGPFQRRNFALACAAAEAFLGRLDPEAVAGVAATLTVPGRLERLPGEPPVVLDVAHNPDGAEALAEGLPEVAEGRPVVACLAVLAEKDARAMIAALAPAVAHLVCTKLPARRQSLGADELAEAAREVGIDAEAIEDFDAALARGRQLARETGGMLLVTGSHYVLAPVRMALHL